MLALVTGASAGIGRDIAVSLSQKGYDLILVARRKERLDELKRSLSTHVTAICADLSLREECFRLCEEVRDLPVDLVVNNAGFGCLGAFAETDMERELEMIQVNICAVHILTKFFTEKFKKQNCGTILNVASSAAFLPGPYMATYYATKAYVLRLSRALREEVKHTGVRICTFCPGPVKTEFDRVAKVSVSLKGMESKKAAEYAVEGAFKGKAVIVPGVSMKVTRLISKIMPECLLVKFSGRIQKSKLRSDLH